MVNVVKSFDGEYEFLSNFCEDTPFKIEMFPGKTFSFSSGEHGYQAYKAFAVPGIPREEVFDIVRKIRDAKTPGLSKKLGRGIKIDVGHWDQIKDDCMRTVVFEKFAHNPDLVDKLLETGAAMLVEGNTWGDTYWGRVDGKGLNRLGSILMEVRGYYFHTIKPKPQSEMSAHILMGW